ncbi:hypothetical protein BaRGS_00030245 [Batillaria attramentaria]|uniref:Uncharacterized protein n=1 Tax=Batillaria attramentaria TaxID=370345 RepID=A0ABD0JUI6_9CAEN
MRCMAVGLECKGPSLPQLLTTSPSILYAHTDLQQPSVTSTAPHDVTQYTVYSYRPTATVRHFHSSSRRHPVYCILIPTYSNRPSLPQLLTTSPSILYTHTDLQQPSVTSTAPHDVTQYTVYSYRPTATVRHFHSSSRRHPVYCILIPTYSNRPSLPQLLTTSPSILYTHTDLQQPSVTSTAPHDVTQYTVYSYRPTATVRHFHSSSRRHPVYCILIPTYSNRPSLPQLLTTSPSILYTHTDLQQPSVTSTAPHDVTQYTVYSYRPTATVRQTMRHPPSTLCLLLTHPAFVCVMSVLCNDVTED